jgi:four helix bundle protein
MLKAVNRSPLRGSVERGGEAERGRSSRSVSANLAEAFRKQRYEKAFISKLSDSEAEAAETQVWLDYSLECGYLSKDSYERLFIEYEKIIGMLVAMMTHPEKWSLKN